MTDPILHPIETTSQGSASDGQIVEVGLLYARQTGKTFRHAHSGVAYGLAGGMHDVGVNVRHIDCAPPPWADRLVATTRRIEKRLSGKPSLTLRGAAQFASWHSRGIASETPIITLTSRVEKLGHRPLISFEDMTAALARRYPGMFHQTDRELSLVQARQARMYQSAVACCVGSDWAAASVVADYKVPEERVHIVGRGHSFEPKSVNRSWDAPRFLFMGRDWERKNGQRVVEAFRAVRRRHPEAKLTLVGTHPVVSEPGVVSEGFLDLSTQAERDRLADIFKTTTCLVMPSLCEPFGLSYLEAGSFAVPSIGTTIGGAAEAIGAGGAVVDPHALPQIENAMLRLSNPTTAQELGKKALINATRFTWPRIAERILTTYPR